MIDEVAGILGPTPGSVEVCYAGRHRPIGDWGIDPQRVWTAPIVSPTMSGPLAEFGGKPASPDG